jgi:glutamate synthase domain-containing protein 2
MWEMIDEFIAFEKEHWIIALTVFIIANWYIYDRFVQRRHQLLINYPIIGRMRYVFEILREPLRQYFSEEKFYESRDKIDWVYKAAKNVPNFMSFSISQPFSGNRFIIKHAQIVKNDDEVDQEFSVTFGAKRKIPYVSQSVLSRSAMSDGALSPEATRAFALAGNKANFPVNTGEGGLTSNYFVSHRLNSDNHAYLEVVKKRPFANFMFKVNDYFFNRAVAIKRYRKRMLDANTADTYIYDPESHSLFRPNWKAPLEAFPKEVPKDMPDLILQVGSGLYGVRDENSNFDPVRYQKVMRFCKMTEIKIAQGAKQTGGKIIGSKVTGDVAYYRGVEQGKDLISPNRFPYAGTTKELFDFIGKLQELSDKPVGMKIVISDRQDTDDLAKFIKQRKDEGKSFPDFITVDSGQGGSATAPLELMESIGLNTSNALFVLDTVLRKHDVRDDIKIIMSGKILTPDDIVILLSLGADFVAIARGFMMSAGCIRARVCSGTGGHICPVGLATQDKRRRASYLVVRKSNEIANYHNNLLKGIRTLLAVMGHKNTDALCKNDLAYKTPTGETFFNIEKHFHDKLHV